MRVPFDRAGVPFVGGALVLAAIGGLTFGWLGAAPFLAAAGFFLFFFRDPDRHAAQEGDVVLSPADGRVLVAGSAAEAAAPPGSWKQISIFLSPMDVHVNRVPAGGVVTKINYAPGRFLPAYRPEAATANERCEIWIERDGQTIVARQIVGVLARRVVCRLQPGAVVHAGDRYGIMKFGSRMDVFLPTTADILVTVGETVRGGETVIAVLH